MYEVNSVLTAKELAEIATVARQNAEDDRCAKAENYEKKEEEVIDRLVRIISRYAREAATRGERYLCFSVSGRFREPSSIEHSSIWHCCLFREHDLGLFTDWLSVKEMNFFWDVMMPEIRNAREDVCIKNWSFRRKLNRRLHELGYKGSVWYKISW